eukprot:Seg202.3 transcript_id=Seg202.3/GoldUCD/mRNA.D3Y31 product="Cyclin-D-binding Myb-like transcription factor 1" protein_id=Seg202.3/GoldUCD/D3Y31
MNESDKTMSSTKLKRKNLNREQDDKMRVNAEFIYKGDECRHNPQCPSKKSRKRKKRHSSKNNGIENKKLNETTITSSQKNFDIRAAESVDSDKIGTDFHKMMPGEYHLLASGKCKKREKVKHKRRNDEEFEAYGYENVEGSKIKFERCGEAAKLVGDKDSMTRHQRHEKKRKMDTEEESAREHKHIKKKRKKRSGEMEDGKVLQSGMSSNIMKSQSKLDAGVHDSEMIQRQKLKSETDKTDKEKKHKKKRNKERKLTAFVVSPEGVSCEEERAKEAPEIPCPADCISLPGGTYYLMNDVAAARGKEAKQKSQSRIHEIDNISPCRKKRKHDNDWTVRDSCDVYLNNNLESKGQKFCTEKANQTVSDLASDATRQDIEIIVSKKRKRKKRKRECFDRVEQTANTYEFSPGQMIVDQKDLSCSPKRRKSKHRNDTNNADNRISKKIKVMISKSSNVQRQLNCTSNNEDKRKVNRDAGHADKKKAHVKQTWFGKADEIDSDNDLNDFAFPSIHGADDVSSSLESDVEEFLKASINQTIMSMEEVPGSSITVDGIYRTEQANLTKFNSSNQKLCEHKIEASFLPTANDSSESDSCQAGQAKDTISKGVNFGKYRKNGLDPELRFLWNLKPADIEQLKREGIQFETGVWTKDETDILERNMIEFCDITGMSLEGLKNLISDRSTASRKTKKQLGVYYMLASGLNRKLKDVHRKLMRSAHPSHSLGAWTVQEETLFLELYQKYGSQWSKIGREMGRSQDSVRDQMVKIQRGKLREGLTNATEAHTLGRWKSDEEERLLKAVDDLSHKIQDKDDEENEKEIPIYWKAVAVRVNTRNAEQCRIKWAYDLSWKRPGQEVKKWTNEDLAKFLTFLRECGEKYEKHVNWMKIGNDLGRPEPGIVLRIKWLHFKRQVPGFKVLEFQEILDWLVKNKVPKLLGK